MGAFIIVISAILLGLVFGFGMDLYEKNRRIVPNYYKNSEYVDASTLKMRGSWRLALGMFADMKFLDKLRIEEANKKLKL